MKLLAWRKACNTGRFLISRPTEGELGVDRKNDPFCCRYCARGDLVLWNLLIIRYLTQLIIREILEKSTIPKAAYQIFLPDPF